MRFKSEVPHRDVTPPPVPVLRSLFRAGRGYCSSKPISGWKHVAVLNPFLRIYLFEGEFFPSPFLHNDSGFQVGREECIPCLPSLFWRRKSFENQPPLLPLMFCASSVILNLVRGVGV